LKAKFIVRFSFFFFFFVDMIKSKVLIEIYTRPLWGK